MRYVNMHRLSLIVIVSTTLILSFIPCFAREEIPLYKYVDGADEIVLGSISNVKVNFNLSNDEYTITPERILKSGKSIRQKIWAYCSKYGVNRCPQQNQEAIFFITKRSQDYYSLEHIEPVELEAEIVSLLKEQERITKEGVSEEEGLRKFIDTFCDILEKNDLDGFKDLTRETKEAGKVMDNNRTVRIFNELKGIHSYYNYRKIFDETLKRQRYRIYKERVFYLGGHEYGYTSIALELRNGSWSIKEILFCR